MIYIMIIILLNILIGIIIGFLLGKSIIKTKRFVGPNSNKIKKIYFKDDNNNCYKVIPQIYLCPISESMS